MKPVEIFSPLPPDECASRLKAVTDEVEVPFSFAAAFGSKPLIGQVSPSFLRLRKRVCYRSSFQPQMTAAMRRERSGTIISGAFRTRTLIRILTSIWLAFTVLISGLIVFATVRNMFRGKGSFESNARGILIPTGVLAFGFAVIKLGHYLASNEARFVTDLIVKTLDGREGGAD